MRPFDVAWRIQFSKAFRKDVRRLRKSGYRIIKLQHLIDFLASDAPVPARYADHALAGDLAGIRDCHIAPDWIVLYQRDERTHTLYLIRTGSHFQVFGE